MNNFAEWSQALLTLLGMLLIGSAFVWAIRVDTRVLAQRLDIVDKRLDKMDTLLERLSDQKSRIDVLDDRMLSQGKRLDEVTKMLAQVAMRYPSGEYSKGPES